MVQAIGIAAAVVGGISLLIGLLLGFAGRLFAVHTDEREAAVRAVLPGNNCGGCGYAVCDALAKAIAAGEAPANACPVGGSAVAGQVAQIMGTEAGDAVRQVAYVHCAGTCDKAKQESRYIGASDCRQAALAPGNAGKACRFGCYGLGTCVGVCPSGALHLQDGIAEVTPEKCISCGLCVEACPQHIIAMRPETAAIEVCCSSTDPGRAVKAVCSAGCIGCGICQKTCATGAIRVQDHLARVDHTLCTGCGACVEKCPVKVIHWLHK